MEKLEQNYQKAVDLIRNRESIQPHQNASPSVNILKVTQLDGVRLDLEIVELLSQQYFRSFSFFRPEVIDRLKPELNLILDSLIYYLSIWNMETTYGYILQNLKFGSSSNTQKALYGLFTVFGRWAWSRLTKLSTQRDQFETLKYEGLLRNMNLMEKVYRCLWVINFIVFLVNGRYMNPVMRLLRMRLYVNHTHMRKQISFDYMNKQLVWHGFTEFLMFVTPLINITKMKNWVYRTIHAPSVNQREGDVKVEQCPICLATPIDLPYTTQCNHEMCYYCGNSTTGPSTLDDYLAVLRRTNR
ncbi:hypothetical protein PROFUN_15484 [Planoprotostelium fungivorum]|uniref:RING-type E3 ubiquitin transferase (cysteine targeting) n=1 Tax=Planoprotostelium fungivorum TaxID=1890364 RepID=A0A2P6MW19_9EUKA|nr:hypothetical protein PROFUN_15484 [Planoprotostelium fungivorum]